MQFLVYYLSLPFLYLISILPFPLLYGLSDAFSVVLFRWLRYRHTVIRENLKNAFPEKNAAEIAQIERGFAQFFCDLVLETVKLLTLSKATIQKRVQIGDLSALEELFRQNRSALLAMGHWGNWEWAAARFNFLPLHVFCAIYHPLSNPYFDRLLYHLRTKNGNRLYAMQEAGRKIIKNRNDLTVVAFLSDQSPPPENAHWCIFLNQDTPVYTGLSRISQKMDLPIVYFSPRRIKRGVYELNAELLVDKPGELTAEEITAIHTERLERDIKNLPETWLWTHRRWKHKKAVNPQ